MESPPIKSVAKSIYFVNPVIDFLWIGGLSMAALFGFKVLNLSETNMRMISASAALMWVVNWPHFSATLYRLYSDRANVAQYPVTSYLLPAILVLGAIAALKSPGLVTPLLVKFYFIWSPYHFSGQSVGITLLYARRSGVEIRPWQRFSLSAFIFGTFIYPTAIFESGTAPSSYYDISYPPFGIPTWCVTAAQIVMWAGGIVFLVGLIHWCVKKRMLLPPILLLPAIAQYFWFVVGAKWPSFKLFVPMFHSLQYLLIAWSMQLKVKQEAVHIEPSKKYVTRESIRWLLINIVGGGALFYVLPRVVSYGGFPLNYATGIVLALVQIHHFIVDGVIWKLSSKSVSNPLMMTLEDVSTPEPLPRAA